MKTMAWVTATLAIGCLFAATDATAQFGGTRGARMRGNGGGPGVQRPAAQENTAELVEFRLSLLQEDLKLTRSQESAWAAYEERTRALAADIVRERDRARSVMSLTAMQRVSQAVDTARDRLTAWEDIASAAKSLYDGLTPQQKALVDARMPSLISALTVGGPAGSPSRFDGPADRPRTGRPPAPDDKTE